MTMTQRGKLEPEDEYILEGAMQVYRKAEAAREVYRKTVVEMIGKSSYREVERLTGLSTNTLQRWKREAGK